MSEPLLAMQKIQKRFGPTVALSGVDLEVRPGEVLALVGENGAGKSTLMKVLSGAHQPDAGEMLFAGKRYTPRNPLHARRQGVAMIYQELSIAPDLSVMENILLGIEPTLGPLVRWRKVRQRASEALAEIGRSDIPPGKRAGELSVAEQQLIEIARSVALGMDVLVLDEPTSSLGKKDIRRLFALIDRLRSQGKGIIYISHFLEEVMEISDRYTVLRDGASVGTGLTKEVTPDQLVSLMVGRNVDELYPREQRTPGEPLLKLDAVAGAAGPKHASLEVRRGEIVGIAGLVGAGRTELLRTIFGLDAIKSGSVTIGSHTGAPSPQSQWQRGIGLVSEDRKDEGLALGLSIADNTTLTKLSGLGPLRLVLPRRQDEATQPWIDRMPIKCQGPRQPISDLSGGNQQKVAIARLLHHDVDVMLLDEPTRGIDIGSKAQIYQLIDQLTRPQGGDASKCKAVLMVSSYLPELIGMCDRIAVMSRGVLSEAKPTEEWTEHSLMTAATRQEVNLV